MLPTSTETDENLQELCNTSFDGILSHNPRELTLFSVTSLYNETWKLTGVKKVPHFIPNFTDIPKRFGNMISVTTVSSAEPSCWHTKLEQHF